MFAVLLVNCFAEYRKVDFDDSQTSAIPRVKAKDANAWNLDCLNAMAKPLDRRRFSTRLIHRLMPYSHAPFVHWIGGVNKVDLQ